VEEALLVIPLPHVAEAGSHLVPLTYGTVTETEIETENENVSGSVIFGQLPSPIEGAKTIVRTGKDGIVTLQSPTVVQIQRETLDLMLLGTVQHLP
jgi:hypothetical protein